ALVEAGAEDRQRLRLVLVLALLVLDLHDEARRDVGDADRGVGRVHGLTARPRRALALDPEVLALVDVDRDVIGLGHHTDRPGRGVDAAGRLRRGDSLEIG